MVMSSRHCHWLSTGDSLWTQAADGSRWVKLDTRVQPCCHKLSILRWSGNLRGRSLDGDARRRAKTVPLRSLQRSFKRLSRHGLGQDESGTRVGPGQEGTSSQRQGIARERAAPRGRHIHLYVPSAHFFPPENHWQTPSNTSPRLAPAVSRA